MKEKNNSKSLMWYQTGVLSERYLEVFLSDFNSLFFLFLQPIAIAIFAGLIWKGTSATPTLYFILLFSSIFFGCVNSCREIVKEKAILKRETLVGLKLSSYIFSKIFILGLLGFAQIIFFYISIRYFLVLDGNPILVILNLYLSLMAGTSLGLLISAFVSTDVMALSLVPVFLIPQLLFSKLIMPNKSMDNIVESLEQLTLVKWGYDSLEQIVSTEMKMMIVFKSSFILIIMIIIMTFLSWLLLKVKDTAE
jgi:hypothetical protein